MLRAEAPPGGNGDRGVAGRPPGRALRLVAGALRGGLEDLPVGIGAQRLLGILSSSFDACLRCQPGLLLPLADQDSRRIAQPEQSLVEAIYQGSTRGRIAFLDKGPAHENAVTRPGSAARSLVRGPSRGPRAHLWPGGSSSRRARSAADRPDPPRYDTGGSPR